MGCIYTYKNKEYTKEEFYKFVGDNLVEKKTVPKYTKILFPTGNTAAKIEGHETLEEFKKQKEDRIKELEKQNNNGSPTIGMNNYFSIGTIMYKKKNNVYYANSEIITKESYENNLLIAKENNREKNNREINQLKQELERVEGPEGFGALKPIWNFYENTVTNILISDIYGKESEFVNYEFTFENDKYERLNDKNQYLKNGNEITQKEFNSVQNSITKQDKKDGKFTDRYYVNSNALITDEYGNTWNEITINPERDLSQIQLQKGKVESASLEIIQKMADDFQSRYNINFKLIGQSEASRLLNKNNIPNAFYYEPTDTAYIIEGKANEVSVIHELGHAFLYKIKKENIDLYDNLVEEARNMPEITEYVNRVYGYLIKDKYEQEVIMRAIDLYNQDKLDAQKDKGLINAIREFLLKVSSYITSLLNMKKIDVSIIKPNTKLKDIADLLYFYEGSMDLSTKTKTQNFTYDEKQIIRDLVNGNESEGIGNIAESARNYIVRGIKASGRGNVDQGQLLEEFLEKNPQFIYNTEEHPLGILLSWGGQSKVYVQSDDTAHVYKKTWLTTQGTILNNLTSILLHNILFSNVKYEILGFDITNDFEKYNIILKQKHVIKNKDYNYDAISAFLIHNYFIDKNGMFSNYELKIRVTDLHPGNVFFRDDELFFIDPIIMVIPEARDIHIGKILEQKNSEISEQEDKSITVDDFYNKYQDKIINLLDVKKIENFNKSKGYVAINVIKRNDGKYIAIKNNDKDVENNNDLSNYKGLLSGNMPVKFYKTGNNFNINPLSNNSFYINEPVEIDEKGNAIIQDNNNIIPSNEVKTIINERFEDINDYYLNNLLKDITLSNYLTSEEAYKYAEYIKNVNKAKNQKYKINIVDNKGFKKLNIEMEKDNIIQDNINFSPLLLATLEEKGISIEDNELKIALYNEIKDNKLNEELTCNV